MRVLYAVESGSCRRWVASATSDSDVRFLYLRPPARCLSIQLRSDVLDYPLQDALDLRAWDLKRRSACSRSRTRRFSRGCTRRSSIATRRPRCARCASRRCFSPRACGHQYLNMAAASFRDCQPGDTVGLKRYFYALRPVLACRWIEAHDSLPPIPFADLVADRLPPCLRPTADNLLDRRRAGAERAAGPRLPKLDGLLADEITRLQAALPAFRLPPAPDLERVDQLFQDSLDEVWGTGPDALA
jgi:hypothetical protein